MTKVGKSICVRLEITDEEKSNWIWEALVAFPDPLPELGVRLSAASWEDMWAKLQKAEAEIERLRGKR